jgi:hypothetical protein
MALNITEQQKWRLRMLVLYGAFISGALATHSDGIQIWGFSLPSFCFIKTLFGLVCPACGITRSVSKALHLDFSQSFQFHPLGPIVAFLLLLHFCYFFLALLLGEKMPVQWSREVKLFSKIDFVFAVLLVGFWIVRLF